MDPSDPLGQFVQQSEPLPVLIPQQVLSYLPEVVKVTYSELSSFRRDSRK